LFTVTMKSKRSTSEKDRLSRAIHAASIAAGYPEDDLFQRFLSLRPSDFRVDLYCPALPKPRADQMLMIEVLVSSGTDTNRKKGLVAALVEKLGEAGNDIMLFFLETDRASGSFGGGPASHHLLPSAVHCHGILAALASKKLEMYRRDGSEARSNGSVNRSLRISNRDERLWK
jgi:hypothetical protein